MKGLAEFVMRGRLQALLVIVVSSFFLSWISAAVLALVTLRKGAESGAWLFMWALLPAGTLVYAQSGSEGLSGFVLLVGASLVTTAVFLGLAALLAAGSVGGGKGLSPRVPAVISSRLRSVKRVTSPKPSVTIAR